jgi:hypothetical protein
MKNEVYSLNDRYFLWKGEYGGNIKYWLFDTKKGKIFKLNETSFTMLSLFDGTRTIEEILCVLMDMYDVHREQLENDLYNLVKSWLKLGVLVCSTKGGKYDGAKGKESV